MNVDLTDLSSYATMVATIAAAWAAIEARRSVNITKRTAESQLLCEFMRDYESPEMADALRRLDHWRRNHGETFAQVWIQRFSSGDQEAAAVDRSRRKVNFYFAKIAQLQKAKLVETRILRMMATVSGINLFYDVVLPLELALNPEAKWTLGEDLRILCPRCPNSDSIHPVPIVSDMIQKTGSA